MVYSAERVREASVMAMGQERSKPPLHNFDLPFLKWGNQKHLRCMKLPDSTAGDKSNDSNGSGGGFSVQTADRHRKNRSPPTKFGSYDARRFKASTQRFVGSGMEEGIDAVREKIMLDLKTEANKMKDEILRKEVSEDDSENEEEPSQSKSQSPTRAAPAIEERPPEQEARPWNLRTRRAAIGAAANSIMGKVNGTNGSPLRSENGKSLRGDKRDREEEKVKFSVQLSRKEIEEDFMAILGQRPARRPKKRPRIVQRQMDTLFPGLWLTEVTVDTYKVPELPENGKVTMPVSFEFEVENSRLLVADYSGNFMNLTKWYPRAGTHLYDLGISYKS